MRHISVFGQKLAISFSRIRIGKVKCPLRLGAHRYLIVIDIRKRRPLRVLYHWATIEDLVGSVREHIKGNVGGGYERTHVELGKVTKGRPVNFLKLRSEKDAHIARPDARKNSRQTIHCWVRCWTRVF